MDISPEFLSVADGVLAGSDLAYRIPQL